MKTLYFDIDGTILNGGSHLVKPRLGGGALERAVKAAGFTHLVCVGNFGLVASAMEFLKIEYDALGTLFKLCDGAFQDEAWFRSAVTLVSEPDKRGVLIDTSGDWWYVDDLGDEYLAAAGRDNLLTVENGKRILIPDPTGNGADMLGWLKRGDT
jgi:hypothetical protein